MYCFCTENQGTSPPHTHPGAPGRGSVRKHGLRIQRLATWSGGRGGGGHTSPFPPKAIDSSMGLADNSALNQWPRVMACILDVTRRCRPEPLLSPSGTKKERSKLSGRNRYLRRIDLRTLVPRKSLAFMRESGPAIRKRVSAEREISGTGRRGRKRAARQRGVRGRVGRLRDPEMKRRLSRGTLRRAGYAF